MADSAVIQVADAVVASLNAGSFALPFTAQRRYRPTFDLAELDTLRVSVVPKGVEITNATRSASYFDCTVITGAPSGVDADARRGSQGSNVFRANSRSSTDNMPSPLRSARERTNPSLRCAARTGGQFGSIGARGRTAPREAPISSRTGTT